MIASAERRSCRRQRSEQPSADSATTVAEREARMSDRMNEANIPAAGVSVAGTSGNKTKSRRDVLRAGAGLVGAAATAPMFSVNAQAQGDDGELARVLGQRRILIKGG